MEGIGGRAKSEQCHNYMNTALDKSDIRSKHCRPRSDLAEFGI